MENDDMENEGYDRIRVNESDGKVFYGYDDEDEMTIDWYDENGDLDSVTPFWNNEDNDS